METQPSSQAVPAGQRIGDCPLILAVDVTGAPSAWISWQEALRYKATGRIDRELGQVDFVFHGGRSRLTGERSRLSISSILAVRGRNPFGWFPRHPAIDNSLLFQRDRHLCCYCGAHKRAEQLTRDHVVPLSRGGKDRWENIVTSCKPCNQRKGARTPEHAGMLMLYVPYIPSLHEALILRNRRLLADQMDFLLDLVPAGSRLRP
jgi:hypothetical protein